MREVLSRGVASRRPWSRPTAARLVLVTLLLVGAVPARAQKVKPWVPPEADSLVYWVAAARVSFQGNTGDSIGGTNYKAYEQVGAVGRRLLRSIGSQNMIQARAVEAILDSLGLDTDIVIEQELPYFALLMVRDPFHPNAKAVGFLYWYREEDLRMQGAQFSGGHFPQARVWWTGNEAGPYEWGVVDFTKAEREMHFTLFRLTSQGLFWNIAQYEDSGYKLGGLGAASWADINGDLKPELTAWIPGTQDSLFEECSGCPRLITELLFVERPNGFKLADTRIVPTPYSTFAIFVRLLTEGSRAPAARLVRDPALVDRALKEGWGKRGTRLWKLESVEAKTAWPEWLLMHFRGTPPRNYRVEFEMNHGRWVIRDWTEIRPSAGGAAKPTPSKAGSR